MVEQGVGRGLGEEYESARNPASAFVLPPNNAIACPAPVV
jgi:hypothetical protein